MDTLSPRQTSSPLLRAPSPALTDYGDDIDGLVRCRHRNGDAQKARDFLASMQGTLMTLGQTFDILHEQSTRVTKLGPTVDTATQIQSLRRQMRAQDKRQEGRVREIKQLVRDILKDQTAEHMRTQIADQIKQNQAAQVRAQTAAQPAERGLPQGVLEQQALESKRQLAEVRCSLVNSDARRANSVLRATNLDEPLAVVLCARDGKPSEVFPKTLKHLFGYDVHAAKRLVQDYDIPVADTREKNLNRFLAHIGVNFNLVPVPHVFGDLTPTTTTGPTLGIAA